MSKLLSNSRPWVEFDVNNAEHRMHYAKFQRNGNWGSCPIRFYLSGDTGDLITMIQRKLIQYYLERDFEGSL